MRSFKKDFGLQTANKDKKILRQFTQFAPNKTDKKEKMVIKS